MISGWKSWNCLSRFDRGQTLLPGAIQMITFCVQRSSEIVMEYTGQLHSSNMKRVFRASFFGGTLLSPFCLNINLRSMKIIWIFQYCYWSWKYFSSLVTSSATQFGLVRYITCRFTYFINVATPPNSLATVNERV